MSRSAYLRPCIPAIHYPDNTGGSIGRGRFRPRGRPRATDTFACRRSHHHLVEMPSVARPRPAPPQLAGDQRTKLQHPAPHRFVGNVQPTLGQKILNVPVAQREAQVEPDRVLDDRRREAMTAIGKLSHRSCYPAHRSRSTDIPVTRPLGGIWASAARDPMLHFVILAGLLFGMN